MVPLRLQVDRSKRARHADGRGRMLTGSSMASSRRLGFCPMRDRRSRLWVIWRLPAAPHNDRSSGVCSVVSGTGTPRAALNRSTAVSASSPFVTSRQPATSPLRPIPCRQWTTTFLPADRSVSSFYNTAATPASECGTCRSGMGNGTNSIPLASASRASFSRSRSRSSSGVSKERTEFYPGPPPARQLLFEPTEDAAHERAMELVRTAFITAGAPSSL